jgi:electron transport complex protein RnfG
MNYIIKPATTLFITSVIIIAALSVVYNYTFEPIQVQRYRKQEAAMRAVLPQASDFRQIPIERSGNLTVVYEGRLHGEGESNGTLVGYVVALSPRGYSDNIDLMVGISVPDERITGMRVVRHSETPGLGALATREDFYRRFDNRALVPLGVVRSSPGEHEINAITSSTITTRAIVNAVNEAIEWYLAASGQ